MQLLRALQEIRTPFLDAVFRVITLFGEETILLVVGLVVIWCMDKKWGMRLFYLGVFGAAVNQLLKALFLIPRPWVLDPTFAIVEEARAAATGYSFPSGHTQGAAMLFGGLALWIKKRWATITAIIMVLLVAFSRLYLGVHTPLDVGVSLATGALILLLAHGLFQKAETRKGILYTLGLGGIALCLFTVLYVMLAPAGERNIAEFDAHGLESTFSLLGGMLGLICLYLVDEAYTHFPTSAVWWAQVLKCLGGIAVVLLVKEGLRVPLNALFAGHAVAKCVRYFLMAVAGGVFWPMTFRWFEKLGRAR